MKRWKSGLRSTDGNCGASVAVELCRSWDWGGYEAVHKCVVDECRGFQGKIFHRGWANCTAIFILRKQNCSLLSRGIFRQHTVNSYRCLHDSLRCERLKVPVCGMLVSQPISNDEELIVNIVLNVHLGEPVFVILHELWYRNIIKEEIRNLYLKLNLRAQIQPVSRDNSSMISICLPCMNSSNIRFKYWIYGGIFNITSLIEVHSAEILTYRFLCLQICIERYTTSKLTHRWCIDRSTSYYPLRQNVF